MASNLNPAVDPVTTQLVQVATAHGFDYATAIVAAHATRQELADVADADELVARLVARCRVARLTNDLMLAVRARRR